MQNKLAYEVKTLIYRKKSYLLNNIATRYEDIAKIGQMENARNLFLQSFNWKSFLFTGLLYKSKFDNFKCAYIIIVLKTYFSSMIKRSTRNC